MNGVLQPWQFLLVVLAGWMNRKQQAVIDFQGTQIQIPVEKLGKKRLLLSDDQRSRLAVKAKVLGRKALQEITTIFTPDGNRRVGNRRACRRACRFLGPTRCTGRESMTCSTWARRQSCHLGGPLSQRTTSQVDLVP